MKCLSIWQPWAALFFSPPNERKECETRPARLPGLKAIQRGERIAIHAAKTLDGFRLYPEIPFAERFLFEKSLVAQFPDTGPSELWENVLTFGAILGTVQVDGVYPVEELRDVITTNERAFGNWRDGRYAIATRNPIRFAKPLPFNGQQGVFFVPDHLMAEAA